MNKNEKLPLGHPFRRDLNMAGDCVACGRPESAHRPASEPPCKCGVQKNAPDYVSFHADSHDYQPAQPATSGGGGFGEPFVDVVFDGPPSHESPRFIELENHTGRSIKFGEWVHREDGYWVLRIPTSPAAFAACAGADSPQPGELARLREDYESSLHTYQRVVAQRVEAERQRDDALLVLKALHLRSVFGALSITNNMTHKGGVVTAYEALKKGGLL